MSAFDESTFDQHRSFDSVTSLRRIQTLYGMIAEATPDTSQSEEETQTTIIPEDYQLYVTPNELDDFVQSEDEDKRLATVHVDVTGDTPTLETVDIRPLRREIVPYLGFSRYPWGRAIDHSITRRGAGGGSNRNTVMNYCVDCLRRWTNAGGNEPAVGQTAEEHPDGWIIQALQELSTTDTIENEIESEITSQMASGVSPRVVATVAVKLDPEALATPPTGEAEDGYYYPGQIDVFNAAMVARKNEKLAEKNTDVPSRGEGTCLVTGEEAEVFGTAEDPLALFTIQHTERFNELKPEHAWRSHPVSSSAALLIQSGASLIEQCRRTQRGRSVYTIPYYTRMDPVRAKDLEYAIQETPSESQATLSHLQELLEDSEEGTGELRFYVISLRNDNGDINVLHELPDATIQPARNVANAHCQVLNSSSFDAAAGFDEPDNWGPYSQGTELADAVKSIVSGRYTFGTVALTNDDNPAIDDSSEWLTFALLSGEPIPADRLLDEYIKRLAQERRKDEEGRLSENHLKAQFTQLRALARTGRLTGRDAYPKLMESTEATANSPEEPPVEHFLTADGELRPLDVFREYRLNTFLANRSELDEPQRQAAFLVGVLVGQLGQYQNSERGMEGTILAQHPAERITAKRIKRLVPELIHKLSVYASDDAHRGTVLFPELEDLLPKTVEEADGIGWTLPTEDLRFHFALGQLYGKRATSRAFDLREQIASKAGIDLESNTDN
ncbi:type I-B CRISPR-associated protein Cas8b/Csh1 [Halocatena halophila]|uniref:type I-B CRISPR-associated protein Cas8b/Csh1 n=1 Tax=Halocatena halophila TaxID=2814576 RepID=UPI002ED28844